MIHLSTFLLMILTLLSACACNRTNTNELADPEMKWIGDSLTTGQISEDITMNFYNQKVNFQKGEQVKILCHWFTHHKLDFDVLVEDAAGNRMPLPLHNLNLHSDLDNIGHFNPHWHYYVSEDPESWKGKTIEDVCQHWGEYTFSANDSIYSWSHITYVTGIGRTHGVTLITDADGIVKDTYNAQTSNLFGYLPFYSTILRMNIYQPRGSLMIDSTDFKKGRFLDGTFWHDGILMYALYSLAATTVLAILIFALSLLRFISNGFFQGLSFIAGCAITYVFGITFLEFCHSYWLLLFPLYLVSTCFWIALSGMLPLFWRCPKCKKHALQSKTKPTGVKSYRTNVTYSYPESGSNRPDVRIDFEKIEEMETTEKCKSCGYSETTKSNRTFPIYKCPKCDTPFTKGMHHDINYDIKDVINTPTHHSISFNLTVTSKCSCGRFSFGPNIYRNLLVERSKKVRTTRANKPINETPSRDAIDRKRRANGYYQKYNCMNYNSFDGSCRWIECRSDTDKIFCDGNCCNKCSGFEPRNKDDYDS